MKSQVKGFLFGQNLTLKSESYLDPMQQFYSKRISAVSIVGYATSATNCRLPNAHAIVEPTIAP